MKNKVFYIFLLSIGLSLLSQAQGLEEDPSIIYMKANVLYDNARYDEAVKMYNRVLNEDESFAQAYIMRAKTKYQLGAYKGTKKDILLFIEKNGVNKEVIKWMAKTELKLENFPAAKNYVETAIELDPYEAEYYRILGSIYYGQKEKNGACEEWSQAATLGDARAKDLLQEHCSIYLSLQKERQQDNPRDDKKNRTQTQVEDITKVDDRDPPSLPERDRIEKPSDIQKNKTEVKDDPPVESVDRDAIQELEIDESLTVVMGNGLGKRKIEVEPEIFLIADKSGRVVIDVCVDGTGKVLSAELNTEKSTINRGGLVSLALRKTKEFSFYPSFRDEQCGYFMFVITAEKEEE